MRARHPMYLADNFWLIGHDEHTGKGQVPPAVIGFGLAGSLLGELIVRNAIDLSPKGELIVVNERTPTERLANDILATIRAEATQPPQVRVSHVRDWLSRLRVDASQRVAQRLKGHGLVETVESRRFLRANLTQPTTASPTSTTPAVHITMRVKNREPMEWARHRVRRVRARRHDLLPQRGRPLPVLPRP